MGKLDRFQMENFFQMHYSTNLMTYNETKRNTIQDYSAKEPIL